MTATDFIVIGGGIAGASVAWRLAAQGRVVLLEAESQPGYHSTGRSAAMYDRAYGNATIRALTSASRAFLEAGDLPGIERPLLTPRGVMYVATAEQDARLRKFYADVHELAPLAEIRSGDFAREQSPILRAGHIAQCVWDPSAADLDVAALHAGWLRGLRERGGDVRCGQDVQRLERSDGIWQVRTATETYRAPCVVNAAGAWADEIAVRAGLAPLGLVPKRRTIAVVPLSPPVDASRWPMTVDVAEQWYFKGEAGRVLVSPADATPVPPGDAWPDDVDVAIGIERFEAATDVVVQHVSRSWAGLRSFFADGSPVLGPDPRAPGLHWLAGLGGYGIQTAAAASQWVAAGLTGEAVVVPALEPSAVTSDRFIDRTINF